MLFIIIASIIIVLDQISKYYIKNTMFLGESIPIIPNIFHITFIKNSGGAFGVFQDQTIFFISASIIAIILLIVFYFYIAKDDKLLEISLSVILGGAVGNLIDRILYYEVVDFFDFRIWPVFNIADIAISVGMGLLILEMFIEHKQKKKIDLQDDNDYNEPESIEG